MRQREFQSGTFSWKAALLISMAVLFIIEAACRFVYREEFSGIAGLRRSSVAIEHEPWYNEWLGEQGKANKLRWHPYAYWRSLPFSGKQVSVTEEGLRTTLNEPCEGHERVVRVFMFGGSTMWGFPTRDEFTIPSCLSRIGNSTMKSSGKHVCVQVYNFGQSGYVSGQEISELLNVLRSNARPDLVVFYDGANDLFSAYQNRMAGIPQNEENRRKEFNLVREPLRATLTALETVATCSGLARVARVVTRSILGQQSQMPAAGSRADAVMQDDLAQQIVRTYEANIAFVEALSRAFAFSAEFVWQPLVFTKTHLTKPEQDAARLWEYLKPLSERTNALLRASEAMSRKSNFHNLTSAFEDKNETIFVDWCHVTEEGNEMVARKITQAILPKLNETVISSDRHEAIPIPHRPQ